MSFEFEWEEANKHKSLLKHGITNQESETTLGDNRRISFYDKKHSEKEDLYNCLGKSD